VREREDRESKQTRERVIDKAKKSKSETAKGEERERERDRASAHMHICNRQRHSKIDTERDGENHLVLSSLYDSLRSVAFF